MDKNTDPTRAAEQGGIKGLVGKNPFVYKVVGILLSIVVAILVEVAGITTRGESFLLSVVFILLVLLFESEAREERHHDEAQTLYRDLAASQRLGYESLSQETKGRIKWEQVFATALHADSALFPEQLLPTARDSLQRSQEAISKYPHGLIPPMVEGAWTELDRTCETFVHGRVERLGDRYVADMIMAMGMAKDRILAVTTIRDADPAVSWWTNEGARYLEANEDAFAGNNVRIFRILLIDDGVDMAAGQAFASSVFARTQPPGMRFAVLPLRGLSLEERMNIVIWDDRALWTATMDVTARIAGGHYTENSHEVEQSKRVFQGLLDRCPKELRDNWAAHAYTRPT